MMKKGLPIQALPTSASHGPIKRPGTRVRVAEYQRTTQSNFFFVKKAHLSWYMRALFATSGGSIFLHKIKRVQLVPPTCEYNKKHL